MFRLWTSFLRWDSAYNVSNHSSVILPAVKSQSLLSISGWTFSESVRKCAHIICLQCIFCGFCEHFADANLLQNVLVKAFWSVFCINTDFTCVLSCLYYNKMMMMMMMTTVGYSFYVLTHHVENLKIVFMWMICMICLKLSSSSDSFTNLCSVQIFYYYYEYYYYY